MFPRTNSRFYLSIKSMTNYLYNMQQYMVAQSNLSFLKKNRVYHVNKGQIKNYPSSHSHFFTLVQLGILFPSQPNTPPHIILSLSQNSYALSRVTTRTWLSHAEKTGPKPRKENAFIIPVRDVELELELAFLLLASESNKSSALEETVGSATRVYSLLVVPLRQRSSSSSSMAREAKRARMRNVRTGPLWVWRDTSRERAVRGQTGIVLARIIQLDCQSPTTAERKKGFEWRGKKYEKR